MKKLLVFSLLLFPALSFAAMENSETSILNFRANQLSVFQGSQNSFSGSISWNPTVAISSSLAILGNFGAGLLVGSGITNFYALEYELLLDLKAGQALHFEAGGGAQTWTTNPSITAAMASVNIVYRFEHPILAIIDGLFIGGSDVFQSTAAYEAKAGGQIRF